MLVKASLDAGVWIAAFFALFTGIFTLLSMSKIWNESFLKAHPQPELFGATGNAPRGAWITVGVLALITVAIGLGAGPVMEYAMAASAQLIEAPAYLQLLEGQSLDRGSE